jgi:arylsulfatase A-like enzyme
MEPNRRETIGLLAGAAPVALGAFATAGTPSTAKAQPRAARPNIVFILSDNVGYGVPSSYNGGILDTPTPRMDKLAAEGLRLTNFNVENQCSPSRAALMTGRLPIRSGIGKAMAAGAPGGLHPWEITLAEMLGEAGYRTAIFGKWHIGSGEGRLPTDQGFDEWFGFETTDIIYWTAHHQVPLRDVDYIREGRKGEKPRNVRVYDEDTRRQIDRMITDRAVEYIAGNAKGGTPFFLYVPFAFAHHPVLAHPDFKGKSPAGEFGDSLLEHDHNVGRVLDALAAAGIEDDTVVVYASDNGPSPLPTVTPFWTIGDSGPWRGEIGTVLEGNIRTPCTIRWPGRIPAGRTSNQIVAIVDFFPTLARIAGGKVPADRPIDGVDQLDFFTGQEKSKREHVLLFLGQAHGDEVAELQDSPGRSRPRRWRDRRLVVPARLQPRGRSQGAMEHHLAEHMAGRGSRAICHRLPGQREEVSQSRWRPAQQPAAPLRSGKFGCRDRSGRRAAQARIHKGAIGLRWT